MGPVATLDARRVYPGIREGPSGARLHPPAHITHQDRLEPYGGQITPVASRHCRKCVCPRRRTRKSSALIRIRSTLCWAGCVGIAQSYTVWPRCKPWLALRMFEAAYLRIEDVDFKAATVHVTTTEEHAPKNDYSERLIPVCAEVLEALRFSIDQPRQCQEHQRRNIS